MSLIDVILRQRAIKAQIDESSGKSTKEATVMARNFSNDVFKDRNQLLVDSLMARMHGSETGRTMQALPTAPCIPNLAIRKLRAKLILEEALETITGLGINLVAKDSGIDLKICDADLHYEESETKPNLIEIFDGCCDLEVVVKGCASACGIALQPGFERTCGNNLLKFAPGHSFNAAGKLVKPTNHPKTDLRSLLLEQGANPEDLNVDV